MGDIRKLFNPGTVALVGASEEEGSVGKAIFENLLLSTDRILFPVNPRHETILGFPCHKSVATIPKPLDLAIIAVRAPGVPAALEECGEAGVDAVIIVSAGFSEVGQEGKNLENEISAIQKKYSMRVVGPNCLGIIVPGKNLNTSFLKMMPEKGRIAFISQSGAFGRALLDWGIGAHIGFSMFVSLGSMIDVDFADIIDAAQEDPYTRSIMIYMEGGVGSVKRFAAAARGFARNKPIIVLKPGRVGEGPGRALSHTGHLADTEEVINGVFKRLGVVRVSDAVDLFNAAGVLDSKHLPKGPKLLVVTNSRGVGAMASRALLSLGGELALFSEKTLENLDKVLPPYWERGNPVDVLRDADVTRFMSVAVLGLKDPGVDGVLITYTAQGSTDPEELADAIVRLSEGSYKPVITSCMGGREVERARALLLEHNVPTYETPEEAVRTYLYMYKYLKNIELLYETPAELGIDMAPPKNYLKSLIKRKSREGVKVLTEEEAMKFLTNYGIPAVPVQTVKTVAEALRVAREAGYPVALKISSPDIIYRVDVGGVVPGITSEQELKEEFPKLLERVRALAPNATIEGVTVQKMLDMIDYELILGSKKDRDFGSTILFGMGGVGVQVFKDFSVGLPPLNQTLARRLIEETKVFRMLQGYRGKTPADMRQLEQVVVAFSNLIVDFPEIGEMDINPIAIARGKAFALDCRIVIDRDCMDTPPHQYPHLMLTPYPTRYITPWTLNDGTEVILRPIKPEDEPLLDEMYSTMSDETFRDRFFQTNRRTTHEMHIRQCSIDYDREMGIVAEVRENGKKRIVAMGGFIVESSLKTAEYAVLVHDSYHGKGLGQKLLDVLIGVAEEKGLDEVYGVVLPRNRKMLKLARRFGFVVCDTPDELCRATLRLK